MNTQPSVIQLRGDETNPLQAAVLQCLGYSTVMGRPSATAPASEPRLDEAAETWTEPEADRG